MNPRNKKEFDRLVDAVRESYRKMQPFREKRTELVTAFCGDGYGDEGEAKTVYLNLLALAVNIYVRQLAVRAPTVKITTPYPQLRPLAADLSLACRKAADDVKLGRTLRRSVTDALFSPMSTVKIGLGKSDGGGTEPFVALVSFDDYVRDMSARSAYSPAFEGDRYYLSKDELMERYPEAKRMKLTDMELSIQDETGEDRAEGLSHVSGAFDDDIYSRVAVQDVWLPRERQLVTYLVNKPDRPLDVVDFEDDDGEGPYRSLWFTDVPDNAMPLPPFGLLRNIHELANSLFRRMSSQARKKKDLMGFSDEESANRFSAAHDGEGIYWDGQKPERLSSGGIDQANMGLFIQVKDMFSWAAGNLDSLGGLSPMAETAAQDEMLSRSASAQLADMQDATGEFAQSVFRQIAFYEWTDPDKERTLQKPVEGTDIVLPVKWDPERRQGDFLDFNFSIIPQSMREESPAVKIQKIQSVLNQFYAPLMPMFQQQGLMIDARRLNTLIADYTNLPELEQIIVSITPEEGSQEGRGAGMPQHTTRTYERVNRPGATRVGKDAALTQMLMGGGAQPDEAAAVARPST